MNDLLPTGVSCEDEPLLFLLTLVIILQLFTTNRNELHVLVLNLTVTDVMPVSVNRIPIELWAFYGGEFSYSVDP